MRHSLKVTLVGSAIFVCCFLSLLYALGGTRSGTGSASLNGQEHAGAAEANAMRLESWGECFQSAPGLMLAASSLQADQVGRERLRRDWQKWRVEHRTAQLIFFLRYSEAANRRATIDEFHASQDLMVDSRLPRQDDLAMLQAAAAWFRERCARTPWLLFATHGAIVNSRRVALHATGGVAHGLAARLPAGLTAALPGAAPTSAGELPAPRCLLLSKQAVELVQRWPTTWQEMLSVRGFNASVRDATDLLCSSDRA